MLDDGVPPRHLGGRVVAVLDWPMAVGHRRVAAHVAALEEHFVELGLEELVRIRQEAVGVVE